MKQLRLFALQSVLFALLAMAQSASATLLLQYKLDEASSGTTPALDTGAPPAANGTFAGSATRVATPHGAALDLTANPGSNSNLDGGDAAKLDGLTTLTASFWLNLRSNPNGQDRLLTDMTAGAGWDWRFRDGTPTATSPLNAASFSFTFALDAGSINFAATSDASDEWRFFAITYDGNLAANNLRLYEGGLTNAAVLLETRTLNQGPIAVNAAPFLVGRTQLTSSDRTPPAWMDDIRIHDTVLDLAALQVVLNENLNSLIPEPSTVGLLGFGALVLWRRRHRARR